MACQDAASSSLRLVHFGLFIMWVKWTVVCMQVRDQGEVLRSMQIFILQCHALVNLGVGAREASQPERFCDAISA